MEEADDLKVPLPEVSANLEDLRSGSWRGESW